MTKTIKVYLEVEDIVRLKAKAEEVGIEGRAWLSHYLKKISKEDTVILDQNLKKVLRLVKV